MSVAEIVAVDGDTLTLAGADVVDGTPVLDVKPYLPFADGVPGATAPPWVRDLVTNMSVTASRPAQAYVTACLAAS